MLGLLLILGALICLGGLFSLHIAWIGGWLVWPLLWYTLTVITWCAHLPGAYLPVSNVNTLIAWGYYAFLAGVAILCIARWPLSTAAKKAPQKLLFSPRTRQLTIGGIALLTLLIIGAATLLTRAQYTLAITLLSTGNPTQGQALLLTTTEGQTALIDEGADNNTLTSILDTHLPFWQRSLDLLVLTDTSASNLAGLQDIVTRYQIIRVIDGGMLHPSVAYARWRSTLSARGLPYKEVRQGTTITLGNQAVFQVLWPTTPLHKSSSEEHDNALILRLLTPELSILLLNMASLSSYALKALLVSIAPSDLQTEVVQLIGEEGKPFPAILSDLLKRAHPSFVLIMPGFPGKSTNAGAPSDVAPPSGPWKILATRAISTSNIQNMLQ